MNRIVISRLLRSVSVGRQATRAFVVWSSVRLPSFTQLPSLTQPGLHPARPTSAALQLHPHMLGQDSPFACT